MMALKLVRALSSGHEHAHKQLAKKDISYVEGSLEDYKANFPGRMVFNERFFAWVSKWFPAVDILYNVRNDRVSKFSAYYLLSKATLYYKC